TFKWQLLLFLFGLIKQGVFYHRGLIGRRSFFYGEIYRTGSWLRSKHLLGLLLIFQGMDNLFGFGIDNFILLFKIEAGGNHGYGDGTFKAFFLTYPHDDIGTVTGLFLDVIADFANLVNGNFIRA